MRTWLSVALVSAAVACGGYLEVDDASPTPEPPASPEPPAQEARRDADTRGLSRAVDDAVTEARARKELPPRCADGQVKVDGSCEPCSSDDQCPTHSCNEWTRRCAAEDWCEADEQCGPGQACDGGLCLHVPPDPIDLCGLVTVHFAWDSSEISPANRERLVAAAPCLAAVDTIYVEAHADEVGTEEYAILLSDRRGTAVRDLLVDAGVPRERLQVISKGSLEAGGGGSSPHAADRRVVLVAP